MNSRTTLTMRTLTRTVTNVSNTYVCIHVRKLRSRSKHNGEKAFTETPYAEDARRAPWHTVSRNVHALGSRKKEQKKRSHCSDLHLRSKKIPRKIRKFADVCLSINCIFLLTSRKGTEAKKET